MCLNFYYLRLHPENLFSTAARGYVSCIGKKPVQHLDRQKRRYFFETSQKIGRIAALWYQKNTYIYKIKKKYEDVAA